jgi:hypothetical protein
VPPLHISGPPGIIRLVMRSVRVTELDSRRGEPLRVAVTEWSLSERAQGPRLESRAGVLYQLATRPPEEGAHTAVGHSASARHGVISGGDSASVRWPDLVCAGRRGLPSPRSPAQAPGALLGLHLRGAATPHSCVRDAGLVAVWCTCYGLPMSWLLQA